MNAEMLNKRIEINTEVIKTLNALVEDQKGFDFNLNELLSAIHNMIDINEGRIYEAEQKLDALTGGRDE